MQENNVSDISAKVRQLYGYKIPDMPPSGKGLGPFPVAAERVRPDGRRIVED